MTEKRQGEELVLLPGMLCDAALWQKQLPVLEQATTVHVMPLTGADTIAGLAAMVLQAAPPRFALAGHSMGGYVAFEILRRAPERVTRLALISTQAGLDSAEETRRRRGFIDAARIGRFVGVTPRLMRDLAHAANLDAELLSTVQGMARRVGREGFVAQQEAALAREDSQPLLPTLRLPVLVLCGEDDRRTPPERSRDIARGISQASLQIVEAAGHLLPLERPRAVNAALQHWLDGAIG